LIEKKRAIAIMRQAVLPDHRREQNATTMPQSCARARWSLEAEGIWRSGGGVPKHHCATHRRIVKLLKSNENPTLANRYLGDPWIQVSFLPVPPGGADGRIKPRTWKSVAHSIGCCPWCANEALASPSYYRVRVLQLLRWLYRTGRRTQPEHAGYLPI